MTATVGKKLRNELQYSQLSSDDRVALADAIAGMEQRKRAADHDSGVLLRRHEDMRRHAGRRGLAVRAGDAEGVFVAPS